MAKKVYTVVISVLLLVLALSPLLCQSAAAIEDISAKSAILIEQSSGKILFEKNADERLPMASTTKIMTAIVVLESADPDTVVTIPREAVGVEGSGIYLEEGETLTVSDLLYALMLESANDAAVALATAVSGSVDSFVAAMNQKASELGLSDTHFENPHGLDAAGHYTSARDLARITAYALEEQRFCQLVSTGTAEISSAGKTRCLSNHNRLLRTYSGAVGVKTGFTRTSGRCLVSAAERDGMTLIAVTLSAPNDWHDHAQLLDYGFENYECVHLAEKGDIICELPVICGNSEFVKIRAADSLYLCLEKDHANIDRVLYLPHFAIAPLATGELAGSAEYSLSGEAVASLALEYAEGVSLRPLKRGFWERIFYN